MPRTYTRKTNKRYTPQDLAQAIEKVKNGELTAYKAAQEYNIPMTTLHEHVKVNYNSIRPNAGRPIIIPLEVEEQIAKNIVIMEKWGFGLSRFEVIELVGEYLRVNNIQTAFNNNIPGPDWFINFRKRHGLSIKKAQPVEYVRRQMTDPFVISDYFELLEKTLKDLNLFESPQFIWNLDETSLCLDPSKTKVVGQKNKPCARTTHGSGKENITVLAGASASGKKLPPLIVFKGKYVWDQWMADLEDYDFELSYAASTKGWMETDIFHNYFEKVLIPNIGEERPVLILYDGHSTHVDARVVELAIRNGITILKLPPHTSHLLQPLDISVFKSFKTKWDSKLVNWQRRNIGTKMPKKVFARAMAETWQQTNPDVIKSGFKKAGIYPFNANVIPVDKYHPFKYQRYQKNISETDITHTDLKTPKSLKEYCIDLINDLFTIANDNNIEVLNTDNVALLSQQSKSDVQMMPFVAKQSTEMPTCLQNSKSPQSQTQPKIHIISNIVIKRAAQPLLQTQAQPEHLYNFEELLLSKIKQDKMDNTPTKKKRVTKGAEVITSVTAKKILAEMEKTKVVKKVIKDTSKIMKKKRVSKQKKTTITKHAAALKQSQPECSGIKNKKKLRPSPDSITSVSDVIMSEHSDSDIIDCNDFEDLDLDSLELYQEDKSLQIPTKMKDSEIFAEKKSNFLSTKGKGIGKKSKGKENQEDIRRNEVGKTEHNIFKKGTIMENKEDPTEKYLSEGQLIDFENRDAVCENQEKNIINQENYKLNDSVLVRYLIRNKWKYYVGFIEDITKYEETNYYLINFLKSTRLQQQLTFSTTKRKDVDNVPESLVVKKIAIEKKNNEAKEYYLTNVEDNIYFT